MYTRNPPAPSLKASTSTRCQKCLQYGHYSYECKVTVQDRPYKPRPSRTQQLFNPKLQQKLSEENPLLQKDGVADAQLTRAEQERARNEADDGGSVSSSDSVDTISTNGGRSPSPPVKRRRIEGRGGLEKNSRRNNHEQAGRNDWDEEEIDRRPHIDGRGSGGGFEERPNRRRHSSPKSKSPARREPQLHGRGRPRRSPSPRRRVNAALRSPSPSQKRDRSTSPNTKTKNKNYGRYTRPSSRSPPRRRHEPDRNRRNERRADDARNSTRGHYRHDDGGTVTYGKAPRERSLSPFSKRAALTAALSRAN